MHTRSIHIGKGIKQKAPDRNKLLESLESSQRLIEHSPVANILHSQGSIAYLNQMAVTLLGAPNKEAILGNALASFVPEGQREAFIQKVRKLAAEGVKVHTIEEQLVRFDGTVIDVEMTGIQVVYSGTISYNLIIRDVTEQKRMEELLRKTDKLSIVGELAAGIAHEIRNPMTSIKGFLQLIQSQVPELYFNIIWSELERISSTIENFLLLAKPQAVNCQKHAVRDLLDYVVLLMQSEALLNNIEIQTDIADSLPDLYCEANHIKQVFINICKNGIEAMPHGGTFCIQCRVVGDELSFSFIDEGTGIDPQILPKLGEPFYTTKEKGTGLGLMVSNKIIQNHGGRIRFSNGPQKGAIVEVIFPVTTHI